MLCSKHFPVQQGKDHSVRDDQLKNICKIQIQTIVPSISLMRHAFSWIQTFYPYDIQKFIVQKCVSKTDTCINYIFRRIEKSNFDLFFAHLM